MCCVCIAQVGRVCCTENMQRSHDGMVAHLCTIVSIPNTLRTVDTRLFHGGSLSDLPLALAADAM